MRTRVPKINRAKLVALGLDKITAACNVHIAAMRRFKPFDRRHRLHQGMLAQCQLAFKEHSICAGRQNPC